MDLAGLRKSFFMTQEEAAVAAGISGVQWNRIENGHATPRLGTIRRIASGFNISPGEVKEALDNIGKENTINA